MVDNLMDLTHETYVHATSIGQKEIDETPVTTKTEGDHVITSRFMDNVMPPPFWRANLRGNHLADDVPVDRWQVCHFIPPSHVMIEVGVAHAGKGGYDADPQDKVSSIVVDFLTPETETSHVVLLGHGAQLQPARTRQPHRADPRGPGQGVRRRHRSAGGAAAQPAAATRAPLLMLNIDAGGVQSRRVIDRLIAAEQQPQPKLRGLRHDPDSPSRSCARRRKPQDIASFELAQRRRRPPARLLAGSHIDVHLPGGLVRQYSLCNDAGEQHRYRIAVLRDPASRGGSAGMHDTVQRRRPAARSASRATTSRWCMPQRTLLLAGGIGVTPLLCMAQRLAAIGADFALHYCTRSPERTAFRDEIAASPFAARVQFHFDDGDAAQKLQLGRGARHARRGHAPVRLRPDRLHRRRGRHRQGLGLGARRRSTWSTSAPRRRTPRATAPSR